MGIDWYGCKLCGETFPDCGDFVMCDCGERWCSDSCAEADGFREEEYGFTPKGSKWIQDTSCSYCRKEDFEDSELLTFALEQLGKSRKEIIDLYIKSN